jgi:hypothetical protein
MNETEQSPPAEEKKRPFQFGLSTLFVVMTLWAIVLSIAVPFFYSASEAFRRLHCVANLKHVAMALQSYESTYGCFPPAYVADESGKPMHSWRVLILPHLGENAVYQKYDFDEPWDGPNNSKLHDIIMPYYHCRSERPDAKETDTSYVVVVGPGTMFPGERSVKLGDISDGTTCTLMVVEVANSGIHWMEPRDLQITKMAPTINPPTGQGISSKHPGGVIAVSADDQVKFLDAESLTPKQLQALLSRAGGEEVDIDEW